jgi:serine/threonine protein kinase
MTLSSGTHLGPYEILSPLGAGGMGEVYRARDTKLNREVALKILPQAFAADAERMARFEREARVLAALNHSNIASIYGLDDSGSVRALVMELAEGPTLADRILQGPIPLEDALLIAKQIAEALEYAHEKGIIHRDLKPANVKVTQEGAVKVLDFGLAKALENSPAAGNVADSPTLSLAATKAGVILGTAAYMAPEQAAGKSVDRRADIWSFGVVLFEMLTGKSAFAGDSVSETLAAVIKSEPDWNALPVGTPSAIARLASRCLVKDSKERLRDIGEARISISRYLADPKAGASESNPQSATRNPQSKWAWIVSGVLVLALAVALGGWWQAIPRPEPAQPLMQFTVDPAASSVSDFVLSPNGRILAFVAAESSGKSLLWVRPFESLTAHALPGTEGAGYPFWSPDSRFLGFTAQGKLKKIDVRGGPPVPLCDAGTSRGGTWNRDGVILFQPGLGGLFRVSAAGGQPAPVTQLDKARGEVTHRWPQFLPDGRHFLYDTRFTQTENNGIYLGSLDSNQRRRLVNTNSKAVYVSPGYLLFVRGGSLMAQPFDGTRLEIRGEAFSIADQVSYNSGNAWGAFSASENGVLSYMTRKMARSQLRWFNREGKETGSAGELADCRNVALSLDGKRIVVDIFDAQGGSDIWLLDATGESPKRFTFASSRDNRPVWSPDGRYIVYYSYSPSSNGTVARTGIYRKALSDLKQGEFLIERTFASSPTDWSTDGRFIVYLANPKASDELWVLELSDDGRVMRSTQAAPQGTDGHLSPNGKWMAYASNESGSMEVYVQPFPPTGVKWLISTKGGAEPRWRRDGKELFYLAADKKLMAVEVKTDSKTFEPGLSRALFETNITFPGINQYAVTADGRQFLINSVIGEGASSPITVVVNWLALIKP